VNISSYYYKTLGKGAGGERGENKMLNWKIKSCPRCGGDLFIDRDIDGWFVQCLQCSHRKELRNLSNQLVPVRVKPAPNEDWSKQRGD
jgi:hypothetical protein